MKRISHYFFIVCIIGVLCVPSNVNAQAKKIVIPEHAVDISKENTYPNTTQNLPRLQASEFAKKLLEKSDVRIDNSHLIHMLNESTVSNAPLAVGYKATIYLGHWALHYESLETTINWEYRKINGNYYDNRGGDEVYKVRYVQENQAIVKGGLTSSVATEEDIKKLMLQSAIERTGLALSFQTIIGSGTKKEGYYNVGTTQIGTLNAYVPAVSEKGKVTFGEVYLELRGNKRTLLVKNITSQGTSAWIPLQDYISLDFSTSNR